MKKILGVIAFVLGVSVSLYFGIWVMFIGGIAGLINVIKLGNFEGMIIAKNIAKIMFATPSTSLGIWTTIIVAGRLFFGDTFMWTIG